ncbi:MAG: malectin domain-containing carbohydrate-binding protein [Snowella sp.]|nr:malectin domain-containing carbohydrate-binding protein [Snowella sp.]
MDSSHILNQFLIHDHFNPPNTTGANPLNSLPSPSSKALPSMDQEINESKFLVSENWKNPEDLLLSTPKNSNAKAHVSQQEKENNKLKNLFAAIQLEEIFGDRETVRIQAGGKQVTDSSNQRWAADTNFIDGHSFATVFPVANTRDPILFQSGRLGDAFAYQIALPKGIYDVNLGFAESHHITGEKQRTFDVLIEDQLALNDFDIWSEVGSQNALVKSFKVNVKDGFLDIDFESVVNQALVSFIEILPHKFSVGTPSQGGELSEETVLVTPNEELKPANFAKISENNLGIAAIDSQSEDSSLALAAVTPYISLNEAETTWINAGGSSYLDGLGQLWTADQNFAGGNLFSTTQAIAGTNDPTLYQTERWGNFSYNIPVSAPGTYQVKLNFAEIYWNGPGLRVFDVQAENQLFIDSLDIWSEVGANTALTKIFEVGVSDGVLNLDFISEIDNAKISAIEVMPSPNQGNDPFLHVVIRSPSYAVDYEGNGSETIFLQGDESHTHEFGYQLTGFTWKNGETVIGTTPNLTSSFNLGEHLVSLTIADSDSPPKTLTDTAPPLNIYPINAVGGVLTQYFSNSGITTLPESADFQEINPTLEIFEIDNKLGGSEITGDVAVVMSGKFQTTSSGTYNFSVNGGTSSQIYINGNLMTGSLSLGAGTHTLEARIARAAAATQPIEVLASVNSGALHSLSNLTHDQSSLKPFINSLSSTSGSIFGGQPLTLKGVAFFDGDAADQVKVHWGNTVLTAPDITVKQGEISFVTPPGNLGTVLVTVETPNGMSEAVTYEYSGTAVPISFTPAQVVANKFAPTQAEWGPDGRLYVGSITGNISIYTFDENYNVTNIQATNAIANLTNKNILGIAFNPFDTTPKIYVAHSWLFANNDGKFINATDFSPYSGQISVLEGPDFSTITPLITGLPVSNHDHGVNGLNFDNQGDLLIAVGGSTNAGIPNNAIGGLPESPLGAAILKAQLSDPNFNGNITYVETATGLINNNQVFGDKVDVVPGTGVTVLAPGARNPFDVAYTTKDLIYFLDNGPNTGFGAASTSATTQGPDPNNPDELNLFFEGSYYGHPNRNRGRYDDRQNVYQAPSVASIAGVYNAPLTTFQPSTNGLAEYRSTTFNGQKTGTLLAQKWNETLFSIQLAPNGSTVENVTSIPNGPTALDVVTGPGGAILGIDYTDNAITVSLPNLNTTNTEAYDIFPWRAPADGGGKFVIGGQNFGDLTNTTVTIGGIQAILTSVSAKRIEGFIPAQNTLPTDMVNVVVNSKGQTSTLANAFRYLGNVTPPSGSAGTLALSAPVYTVNENGTPVSAVTITRTGGSSGAVSVTLTPSNGTAIAPNDYNNTPILVNFANGETSKTVTIPIVNDTIVESAETINLTLSNATGGATLGSQNTAILSILDNDSLGKILINAGGGQYTDIAGQVWSADQYFTGSTGTYAVPSAIAGTNDDSLYQNERYGNNFSYNVPVSNGTYLVNLNFAEIYWNAPGQRLFNVSLEGQTVLQNFDIWSQAGGQNIALTQSFEVTVSDGVLNLDFTTLVDNAQITSLELLKLSDLSNNLATILINTGGGQYTDATGQVWLADQYFTGSTNTYAVTSAIAGTNDDSLYQDERYGNNFSYNIPVSNGTYLVDLNFAELYWNASGQRIFDVTIEGQTVLQNFDIWSQAGGQNIALTKSFQVTVTDGVFNLNFSTLVDNAQITSLKLLQVESLPAVSGVLALSEPLVLAVG